MSQDRHAGRVVAVDGLAAELGVQPRDQLLEVNHHAVRDVIDVQFYAAEPTIELLVRRAGQELVFRGEPEPGQPLGLAFEHPTFDTDIRRCNNRCLFCFVSQMAPAGRGGDGVADPSSIGGINRFRSSLYVRDDDYRYSFLDGNYVTLTNLTEADWERIGEQRLSPLYVSVHATNPGLRRELLGNPDAPDVLLQLDRLRAMRIEVHTQLVIVPGWNDGAHLNRSVEELAEFWPSVQSISVVPVGLSRFHRHGLRAHTPQEAAALLDEVTVWQRAFRDRWQERLVYATDEWYLLAGRPVPPLRHYRQLEALQENGVGLVSRFLARWRRSRTRLQRASSPADSGQPVVLVTGTLFAPVLHRLVGQEAMVRPVANTTLGETITVAGLLMAGDVVEQLPDLPAGSRVFLPAAMFRGPGGVALDGWTLEQVGAALDRPVTAVDQLSEVWRSLRR